MRGNIAHLLDRGFMCHLFVGMWRSLVARTAGGRKVAGSSPVIPTIYPYMRQKISVRGIIKKGGKTLLGRRVNGRASILGKYELPGGSVDFKEQPQDALKRYIRNYLSAEIETVQLFDALSFIDPEDSGTQYIFIIYLVSLNSNKLSASSKYDKYVWQDVQNIQQNTLTNSTVLLLGLNDDTQPDSAENDDSRNTVALNTTKNYSIIYSDGGSRGNPGPSASAFVIMDSNEQIITTGGVYLGVTTNNQAEYHAVYQALKKAQELHISSIDFRLDSNLVVNQLNGLYKIRNRDLWPIYQNIKEISKTFERISFVHVGRELNHIADKLVNQILDEQTA